MELRKVISIAAADLDYFGTVSAARLFEWMQRLADEHANQLGVGREALKRKNLVWMLARSAVRFYCPICAGERIEFHTWTGQNTRAACPRHFALYNTSGAYIGGATTLWMLIQPDERRIVSAQKAGVLVENTENLDRKVEVWPEKLPQVEKPDYSVKRTPVYTDLDINGHVNSARYVSWMMDAIPIQNLDNRYIQFMSINYQHEIKPEDSCCLMIKNTGEEYIFRGRSPEGEQEYFQAKILLSQKQ